MHATGPANFNTSIPQIHNYSTSTTLILLPVTPQDRSFRCLPGFPGFVVCFVWFIAFIIASCALHHVIMPSCHFFSQLNKLHGSLIHLNRGSSHGEILFITYKSLLQLLGSYCKYSINLESPITKLHYSSTLLVSDLTSYIFPCHLSLKPYPCIFTSHFLLLSCLCKRPYSSSINVHIFLKNLASLPHPLCQISSHSKLFWSGSKTIEVWE